MQEQLDISKLGKEQLESLAYRLVKQLNTVQQNLNIVENEIVKREQTPEEDKALEEKKKVEPKVNK